MIFATITAGNNSTGPFQWPAGMSYFHRSALNGADVPDVLEVWVDKRTTGTETPPNPATEMVHLYNMKTADYVELVIGVGGAPAELGALIGDTFVLSELVGWVDLRIPAAGTFIADCVLAFYTAGSLTQIANNQPAQTDRLDDIKTAVETLVVVDYATETTLGAVALDATLQAVDAKLADVATETSLAALEAKVPADPATETSLAALLAAAATEATLAALEAKATADPATETTLATLATEATAATLATEATAAASLAELEAIGAGGILDAATETTLLAVKAAVEAVGVEVDEVAEEVDDLLDPDTSPSAT
jgi:hypothetical protein